MICLELKTITQVLRILPLPEFRKLRFRTYLLNLQKEKKAQDSYIHFLRVVIMNFLHYIGMFAKVERQGTYLFDVLIISKQACNQTTCPSILKK